MSETTVEYQQAPLGGMADGREWRLEAQTGLVSQWVAARNVLRGAEGALASAKTRKKFAEEDLERIELHLEHVQACRLPGCVRCEELGRNPGVAPAEASEEAEAPGEVYEEMPVAVDGLDQVAEQEGPLTDASPREPQEPLLNLPEAPPPPRRDVQTAILEPENGVLESALCLGCQRPILWARTPKGKRMPLDRFVPARHENGVALIDAADTHWASCPERQQFERKRDAVGAAR